MAPILERLRRDALSVFRAGLEAASPENAIKRALSLEDGVLSIGTIRFDLRELSGVVLLGGGKASRGMGLALWRLLADRVQQGVLSVPYGQGGILEGLHILEASHPLPDDRGVDNTRRLIRAAAETPESHLILFLISGGASSLLVHPPEGVALEDLVEMNRALLSCGAEIGEMNTVRRHVSEVKGGRLALSTYPTPFVTLIISDVPGDDPSDVGSGPSVPDATTYLDAQGVIEKYSLGDQIPQSILEYVRSGVSGDLAENPDRGDPAFSNSEAVVIANSAGSVRAACAKAEEMGYNSLLLPDPVTGDTEESALRHIEVAKHVLRGDGPVNPPACIVSGGETTVRVKGSGRGGRNQEFGLHAAIGIEGEPVVVLSADTDGADGSTDAAGAICDGQTLMRARKKRMAPASYLYNNDTYRFFQRLGDLVKTGPTGTNVMDLHVVMVGENEAAA